MISQIKATLDNLPIQVKINRCGELYTDKTLIVAGEENAQTVVKLRYCILA
jgi:hypothetical protein